MFLNYPNNPSGAIVPEGFFERVVEFAREHEILVVHDNAYSETTYDGYVAPSFLATPGAKEVGVEVFSLSKGFNMTGWRCAAILGNADAIETYWRLKTNVDSGLFEAVQLAGAAALRGPRDPLEQMNAIYARRRDLVVGALREIGVEVNAPKGTIYVWAPVPEGHTSTSFGELVLEEAAVVVSPGSMYGPSGEGFFRISLTTPDERIEEAVERMRGAPLLAFLGPRPFLHCAGMSRGTLIAACVGLVLLAAPAASSAAGGTGIVHPSGPDPALKAWPSWPYPVACGRATFDPASAFDGPTEAESGEERPNSPCSATSPKASTRRPPGTTGAWPRSARPAPTSPAACSRWGRSSSPSNSRKGPGGSSASRRPAPRARCEKDGPRSPGTSPRARAWARGPGG